MRGAEDNGLVRAYTNLLDEGFTERQAMAIMNLVSAVVGDGRNIDMVDLLPLHSWLWHRWKQRRETRRREKK